MLVKTKVPRTVALENKRTKDSGFGKQMGSVQSVRLLVYRVFFFQRNMFGFPCQQANRESSEN